MTDVFISYSRKDQDFVRRLHTALSDKERQSWVDWEGIPLTADWWAEISKGIEFADTFLFIISPDFVASEVCNREIEYAVTHNKRLVPIVRREAMPEQMNKALARHNWLFARDDDNFDDVFDQLLDALNTDLEYVQGHTRLLVRARDWQDRGEDASYLLRGSELLVAESWLAQSGGKEPKPTELQTNYILASRRASNSRQRSLLAGVSVALAATLVLAVISAVLFGVAENRRQESDARGTGVAQQAATATNALGLSEIRGTQVAEQAGTATNALGLSESRGTQVAEQAGTATNALGLSESRGTEVALGASTAVAAEATSARRAVEWQGLAWSVASERAGASEDHDLELALALQAMSIPEPPPEVGAQMLNAAYAPGAARVYSGAHQGWIDTLTVSADGRYLLSSSLDGALVLWDTSAGEVIQSEQFGQGFDMGGGAFMNLSANSAAAFHPTLSNIAVIGANNGSLMRVNIETWEVLASINTGSLVEAIAFSPDGRRVAVGLGDFVGNIQIYDADSLDLLTTLSGHTEDVVALAFSPDSKLLLSGSEDATAHLWDMTTGESLMTFGPIVDEFEPDIDLPGVVFGANTDKDRPTVIVATNSGLIVTLDRETGEELFRYDVGYTPTRLAHIAISPDRNTLISAGYDGIGILWDARNGQKLRTFRSASVRPLAGAVFSPDGLTVYTASQDGTLRRWYVRSGAEAARFSGFENGSGASALAFSPDGSRALVGGGQYDPDIVVWNLESGALERRLEGHIDAILAIDTRISSDTGHLIAISSGWDPLVRLWDIDTGEALATYDLGGVFVSSVEFMPDGKQALVSIYSERIAIPSQTGILDLETGEIVRSFETGFDLYLTAAISPNASQILMGGAILDGTGRAALVDAATGEILLALDDVSASAVQTVAFSADGTRFLVGTQDGQIIEWSLPDGREIARYVGHTDVIADLNYMPDSRYIVSAGYDNTFRIWDVQTLTQTLTLATDDDGRVAAFSPAGTLFTTSRDGSLTRWNLDLNPASAVAWSRENRFVRDLSCAERQANRIVPLCEETYPP